MNNARLFYILKQHFEHPSYLNVFSNSLTKDTEDFSLTSKIIFNPNYIIRKKIESISLNVSSEVRNISNAVTVDQLIFTFHSHLSFP